MTAFRCKTHGRVLGIVETCSHVARQIHDGKSPQGHRVAFFGDLLVCDDCFKSLGFECFLGLTDLRLRPEDITETLNAALWKRLTPHTTR